MVETPGEPAGDLSFERHGRAVPRAFELSSPGRHRTRSSPAGATWSVPTVYTGVRACAFWCTRLVPASRCPITQPTSSAAETCRPSSCLTWFLSSGWRARKGC